MEFWEALHGKFVAWKNTWKKHEMTLVFGALRQIFEYAIDHEWIEEPNPARSSRQSQSGHIQKN